MRALASHRAATALRLSLTAFVVAGCASPGGGLPTVDLANADVVEVHATSAFTTFFGAADRAAFGDFVDATQNAATRADLNHAWRASPLLVAKGEQFLDQKVFAKALADGSWKPPAEPAPHEGAFVAGTRKAASKFSLGQP